MRSVLKALWVLTVCAISGVAAYWAVRLVYEHTGHHKYHPGALAAYVLVGAFAFLAVGVVLAWIGRLASPHD